MAVYRDPVPAPDLRYTTLDRRLRGVLDGAAVIDTASPILVWMPHVPVPVYGVPEADVRAGLAEELDAAWTIEDPDLQGHVAFWFSAMDAWFEEDEQVDVHPRDPFHRVDVRLSSREVRVECGGHVLAESVRPLILFETGLPRRFYLPREDVRLDLMEPSDTRTSCPYKGEAVYWSPSIDGVDEEDLAWSYPEPVADMPRIRDLVAFFDERCDVTVDGELQARPQTPFSKSA